MTFLQKKKKRNRKEQTNKKATATTNNHNSYKMRELSEFVWGTGGQVGGRTTETNMAVSFTVYSSTPETWYKAIEFCLLGLSFHSSHHSGV